MNTTTFSASPVSIGVIGGSGLYQMDGLTHLQEHAITTPFGPPSDSVMTGQVDGTTVAFLARHARGHRLMPSEIPFLANIWALKFLGVKYLLSVSAVGSLQDDAAPLDVVLPDQFIDHTRLRPRTFFGDGAVAHAALGEPVCLALREVVWQAGQSTGFGRGKLHLGGTYLCIEGPQFSTRAESLMFRQWGATVVGMTNMPEARLAREAEMAYATIALVTDYDSWRERTEPVTAGMAMANLAENAANAQRLVRETIRRLAAKPPASLAHDALASALVTPVAGMRPELIKRLKPLLQKYL